MDASTIAADLAAKLSDLGADGVEVFAKQLEQLDAELGSWLTERRLLSLFGEDPAMPGSALIFQQGNAFCAALRSTAAEHPWVLDGVQYTWLDLLQVVDEQASSWRLSLPDGSQRTSDVAEPPVKDKPVKRTRKKAEPKPEPVEPSQPEVAELVKEPEPVQVEQDPGIAPQDMNAAEQQAVPERTVDRLAAARQKLDLPVEPPVQNPGIAPQDMNAAERQAVNPAPAQQVPAFTIENEF